MASSRKRAPRADPLEQTLLDAVADAVAQALRPAAPRALPMEDRRVRSRSAGPLIIAVSGGRDSVALLDLACRLRASKALHFRRLLAVHVNHGLQPAAADFERHCVALARVLDVELEARHVAVQPRGRGVEAAARAERYAALAETARRHRAHAVLTAHHLDDRIETFLIQWLRGAGPDGLAAFPPVRAFDGDLRLVRPLADVARAQIDAYVARRELAYVDDPSNRSEAMLRNALRARVLPALEAVRPGYARSAARAVDLVAEAAETLKELGEHDLEWCVEGAAAGALRLDRLVQLSAPRRALVVRHWLAAAGIEAPSRARLYQVLDQSLLARSDARLLIRLGEHEVRRHRGLMVLRPAVAEAPVETVVTWRGEEELAVPSWGGVLQFIVGEHEGFDPQWLRDAPLMLRARRGGERFKPHAGRPSRTLKRAFQDAGVPEYERGALPLVWRGEELVYVAGIGPDVRLIEADGARVRLHWRADRQLLAE
jgi:tRNA(Ile)-lysidine synthase